MTPSNAVSVLAQKTAHPPAWTGRLRTDWRAWAVLLMLVYSAAAASIWHRSLIGTEIWALYYAGQPLGEQMAAVRQDLVHPPLMYLVQKGWLGLLGHTDNAAKLLPLAINLPALLLFTYLAHGTTRHWRLASFLFAASYLNVGAAPMLVRMYGLGILLTILCLLVWRSWHRQPATSKLALWLLVAISLIYTHLFGLLIVSSLLAVNTLLGPRRRVFAAASILALLSFLPWLLYVWPVYESRGLETNLWWVQLLVARPHKGLALLLYEYLGRFPFSVAVQQFLAASAVLVHLGILAVAWKSLRRSAGPEDSGAETKKKSFWVMGIVAALPVAALLVFSMTVSFAFSPRFVLGILPAYWLCLALLGEYGGRRGAAVLYGLVLPWVVAGAAFAINERQAQSPVHGAALSLSRELKVNDLILVDSNCNEFYWEWTKRAQAPEEPLKCVELPTDSLELPHYEQLGFEQEVRLSVLEPKRLDEIDLTGAGRIWLFGSERERKLIMLELLDKKGFRPQPALPGDSAVLTLLTHSRSPPLDRS